MKQYVNPKFPHFLHGADYNPEQWADTPEIWERDMELMKQANCNEMTLGIFSWAVLEPEEGVYDFSFLDTMIEKIHQNGGKVILATPSGARPRWLAEKYPEVLRVAENGQRNLFGARHNHCYTSPVYREKVRRINTALAQRYGSHPAVVAWHISNEYGGRCWCDLCQNEFRDFLRQKYAGDIHSLNQAWWSDFWSHRYRSFEEIELPVPRGETSIHGLNLDFRRFASHQTCSFMRGEVQAIRAVCPDIPVTANLMYDYYDINYWDLAKEMDVVSWDNYPDWHKGDNVYRAGETAFQHSLFRSLKGRPFLLMESAPGLVNWKPYNKLKRPGVDRLASLQAVAHGSDSVQYFQWRKSRGSVEKFHGAVVDHVGHGDTRVFRAVQSTGRTLQAIDEVCGTPIRTRVAIVYDWENRWALDDSQGFQKDDKKYQLTCLNYFLPLWEKGVQVDLVSAKGDFSKYDLLIAPMLYMVTEKTGAKLRGFVEQGGTLYATYMLGMVDGTDLCHLGGFPGAGLMEVLGLWNEEIDTLYPGESFGVALRGKTYTGVDYAERIHPRGAQVLAGYTSEFYAGEPALTVHEFGKGRAYYQAFRDQGDFWARMLEELLPELGISPALEVSPPRGVVAHWRGQYLFLQNYSGQPVQGVALGRTMVDMESGVEADRADLDGYDARIFHAVLP